MSDKVDRKLKELKLRQQQVAILEREIRLLSIEEKERKPRTLTLPERFPKHSIVRLIGKNEKYRLRRKRAEVVGYTNCYIRLERKGGEEFLRAPENLGLIEDGE